MTTRCPYMDADATVGAIAHIGISGRTGDEGRLAVGRRYSTGAAFSGGNGIDVGPADLMRIPLACGTAYLQGQRGFAARPLALERRQASPARGSNGVGRFFRGVDVQGKFVFLNSADTDPTFGLRTRFRRPYLFSEFGERNQLSFGPEAELRANSSEQDDENSVILSVPITYTRTRGQLAVPFEEPDESPEVPLVDAFILNVGPTLEVEKSFRSGNLISDGELVLGLPAVGGEDNFLYMRPYVGFEAGMGLAGRDGSDGLASDSEPHVGESVLRMKAGIAARYGVELRRSYLYRIVLDLEFIYRQLYAAELIGRWDPKRRALLPDDEGVGEGAEESVIVRTLQGDVSEGSRRYLEAALRFVFAENWEFVVSYVRGELPPRFVSVDKVEAGFGFRFGDW